MKRIPFYSPEPQHRQIQASLRKAVDHVIGSNQFILGQQLSMFEAHFASFLGGKYCAGVASGFDALYLSLRALRIGAGDEVIVPAHTCVATWLAVTHSGALPVPVDAHDATWLIDTGKIEQSITSRTKAILAVHLYGMPCEMDAVMAIAQRYGLKVIEDNAQATGARYGGMYSGTLGHCNAFSFYPTKNLGALGDGGAVVTEDEEIYKDVSMLRNYGQQRVRDAAMAGVNSRLDELQAAMLFVKLQHLQQWNTERIQLATLYHEYLRNVGPLQLPTTIAKAEPVYHIFAVLAERRDELAAYLYSRGIDTVIHYPLLPFEQVVYRGMDVKPRAFPVAKRIARHQLSLPLWPGMSVDDVSRICTEVMSFYSIS